jgi:hypothetical protein
MTPNTMTVDTTACTGTLCRVAPAVGLVVTAPLVAEFLLGNLPVTMLPALVALAPMYGGGALLIRELVRRTGRGVPSMLVLGLAYGLGEEGLVTQSLFNPDYAGAHLLDEGFVRALGIAVPWTLFVLTLHAVWSTTVPILLVEACMPGCRRTPWLGRPGLAVAAVLLVLGAAANTVITQVVFPYVAPPVRLVAVAVLVVAVAVLAFRLPHARRGAGTVPTPAVLGLIALAAGAVFMVGMTKLGAAGYFAVVLVLDATLAAAVVRWSTRPGWTDAHTLALTGGALLTYAWHAFPQRPAVPVSPALDLAGNVAFAAAAVALLAFAAARTLRTPTPAPSGSPQRTAP